MKKKISLIAITLLFVFASAVQAAPAKAQASIRVYLDGQEIKFQAPPVMKNGVTFVQFRPLFQALDYSVQWNNTNKQVTGTYIDQKLQMTIGQKTAYVNGVKTTLEIAPFTESGNTLVPLRFVAEATGLPVKWDQKARTIHIDRQGAIDKAEAAATKLYQALDAAETAKNLELAKQSILPKSPALAYQQELYDEQFKRDLKVSSRVLEVTVAGSSIHAFTARSFERVSGPFSWDATIYYESLLKKDAGGNWKLHDINEYDMEYLVSDELLDAKPNVPENVQKAISETIDTQYKGFNDEDGPLLMSVIHPESSFYDIFKTSIDEGIFDEVNFNLKAEVIRTIFHQGDDAVLYIEEVDDADGDMFYSTSLYWLKQSGGKWLIYDVLELDIL
ncbi:hypothetical protein JCM10914A_25180 [Paenibacillus sp. JCM 10914]|uniref:copper amine oxidase N-terminal domain-containing protein n=1 Tax=Paenibacillus sp. JCM 10914 TaxID=1236974 RepID=UPI0003CC4961|nr:copper amine oxidase N-terminal domain-containing protein [Paenibacillus sp. JCM 10914]GAE09006.1 copper amine oxidase-like protein [Paenibacillus sp. JCM 10914]